MYGAAGPRRPDPSSIPSRALPRSWPSARSGSWLCAERPMRPSRRNSCGIRAAPPAVAATAAEAAAGEAAAVAAAGAGAAEVGAIASEDFLGVGLGYRPAFRADLFANRERVDFLEIVADHYFDARREKLDELDLLAAHFPLIPHGLDLSLGSAEGIDR